MPQSDLSAFHEMEKLYSVFAPKFWLLLLAVLLLFCVTAYVHSSMVTNLNLENLQTFVTKVLYDFYNILRKFAFKFFLNESMKFL